LGPALKLTAHAKPIWDRMFGGSSEIVFAGQRLAKELLQYQLHPRISWNCIEVNFVFVLVHCSDPHSIFRTTHSTTMGATSITVVFSPYHVGLRDHRVGDGPNRIRALGVIEELEKLGVTVHFVELPSVDDFEGEIGRSFELLRRTSKAVTDVIAKQSFPLILSGNCMASAGVACGLGIMDLGWVYFDAHDDMDTPSTNTNGYLDAMGLSMLGGESFHRLAKTIPGYAPHKYDKMIYCGLRDIEDSQKETVRKAGAEVIWGEAGKQVDFAGRLAESLSKKDYSPALVHLDLDVLDESIGKVNGYESPGGLHEDDLLKCMDLVPQKATPTSLTVCSFNPNLGDGDKIATIGVNAIVAFVRSLLKTGALVRK
jgi:arginase